MKNTNNKILLTKDKNSATKKEEQKFGILLSIGIIDWNIQ